MTVGLVITVKNEMRLLRTNLLYHYAIGVDKVFVYFDNTTDNGKASISNLEFVEISDSVSEEKYKSEKSLSHFNSNAKEHHTARQCLNTYDAIQRSKALNIDWLISIDADELIITDKSEGSQLKPFFQSININIDVVNFKPYEVLQTQVSCKNIFEEAIYFKACHKFKRRIDNIYKEFYNPFSEKMNKYSYWYGHHMGKSAIRVNSEKKIIPKNVHRLIYADKSKIKSIDKKGLLHYHMYDAQDFIKKFNNFKNHPNTFLSGNKVGSLKLLCRDIVNSKRYSKEELIVYFERYIMFSSEDLKHLLSNRSRLLVKRKQRSVIKITSVQSVFKTIIE